VERSDLAKLLAPWLMVPLTALDWWIAWSRLPEHVVVKYGAHGQPTGYRTREDAMMFDVGMLGGVMLLCTVILLIAAFSGSEKLAKLYVGFTCCEVIIFLVVNAMLWMTKVQ
jgi:hypothetical protein